VFKKNLYNTEVHVSASNVAPSRTAGLILPALRWSDPPNDGSHTAEKTPQQRITRPVSAAEPKNQRVSRSHNNSALINVLHTQVGTQNRREAYPARIMVTHRQESKRRVKLLTDMKCVDFYFHAYYRQTSPLLFA
jgi:hypothetical protein